MSITANNFVLSYLLYTPLFWPGAKWHTQYDVASNKTTHMIVFQNGTKLCDDAPYILWGKAETYANVTKRLTGEYP